jgi:hypothetical protein
MHIYHTKGVAVKNMPALVVTLPSIGVNEETKLGLLIASCITMAILLGMIIVVLIYRKESLFLAAGPPFLVSPSDIAAVILFLCDDHRRTVNSRTCGRLNQQKALYYSRFQYLNC